MFSSKQWTYIIGVAVQLCLLFQGCHAQTMDSTNIGVIIGAAVGGVILLVLLIILFMLLCGRSKSDGIRYLDDRSCRSSRSSRHSHHYKRPPPPRPVPPGVWTTMPHQYGLKVAVPRPPPPVIIPVRVPPRPPPPQPRRERLLQRTVRRAKTMVKRLPAMFQARRFKPYVPPQVYASAATLPLTKLQQEQEMKVQVGQEEISHTEQPQTLTQLSSNIKNCEDATAHAVHEYDVAYEQGGTMAKAYSDYSFHGNVRCNVRHDETGENVARAFSSYSIDNHVHHPSKMTYDDVHNRARSDLGLARPSQMPIYNPYGSGVVMRPHQLEATNSSPQMQLFSRENGMPLTRDAAVHRREPRRVPSANDPNALYAQPERLIRTSVLQPAPTPPAPPPPPPNIQGGARDGFATTGMKVTADNFRFLDDFEDQMEFGAEE